MLVGPGQESYTVHKDLICAKSPVFEAACNGNFIEGIQGIVRLPEDKPETFVLLLEWLYTERVAESDNAKVVDWHGIASLYVLAEKLQIHEIKNSVVDTWIRKAEDTKEIPLHEVPYVYYNTPEGAPLRQLLVDMVACDGETESVRQAMDGLPWEFLLDLAVTLLRLRRQDASSNTRFWKDPILYHEIPTTSNVSEAEA